MEGSDSSLGGPGAASFRFVQFRHRATRHAIMLLARPRVFNLPHNTTAIVHSLYSQCQQVFSLYSHWTSLSPSWHAAQIDKACCRASKQRAYAFCAHVCIEHCWHQLQLQASQRDRGCEAWPHVRQAAVTATGVKIAEHKQKLQAERGSQGGKSRFSLHAH